ncbi:uncharacterized protein DUF968 [Modicisalibacter xianhensis]|uniref:Uncharacterized protein DUF968 n=1 Tax=Modicisalibacter xianhensis TaxID=442341 RepID=A0A4R8FW28_9GAMM|nr:DUF968 domain-containing protein [Halomonas xianhensis]TDX30777.1 uncharacterized protein DUF968 [Halomonas xianhensis]
MKRSQLARKTPLSAHKPMQKARRKPQKAAQKDTRFRSQDYLAFVRTLPCCVCGGKANAAHHLKGIWNASGAGLKAPDSLAMPVCDGPGDTCHRRIHSEAHLRWQQAIFLIETINAGLDKYPSGPIHDALVEAQTFVVNKTKEAE